jgi:hypothetical protein
VREELEGKREQGREKGKKGEKGRREERGSGER